MKTYDYRQGSPEWLALKAEHERSGSKAPMMMGTSPHLTRDQLVAMIATGGEQEFSRFVKEVIFERGHEVEAFGREFAEEIVGEDFFPVTGVSDDGYLLSSFDGVTILEDINLEVKQWNKEKAAMVAAGQCPPCDLPQIDQGFAVNECADQCLYVVTDGTRERTVHLWINRSPERVERLLAAWQQFDADVEAYAPSAPDIKPEGAAPAGLPALRIQLSGEVRETNLPAFREQAMAMIASINTKLVTDNDFADAEATVKYLKAGEDQLKAAKAAALSQTADIDELFRTVDEVSEQMRRKRLDLDKLVQAQKQAVRDEILREGRAALADHMAALDASLDGYTMPEPVCDLAGAMKGKKTIASLRSAVNDAVAAAKIDASQMQLTVQACVKLIRGVPQEYSALFADARTLVTTKQPDDLEAIIKARIADHVEAKRQREEADRERIRAEEAEKLRREQAAAAAPPRQADPKGPFHADAPAPLAVEHQAGEPNLFKAKPKAKSGPPLKLRDINAMLAPIKLTAEAISQLGIEPQGREGSAVLFAAADFDRLCAALICTVETARDSELESAA